MAFLIILDDGPGDSFDINVSEISDNLNGELAVCDRSTDIGEEFFGGFNDVLRLPSG